ncbi:zinc finger protein 62 homolog isoform X1 [Bombyx mori]|uniref:C2H2-type domain-containing protein n=2 Tax=Bombyx mori TaxID=7091 RepID=A0A8R1WJX8_BOMMO|nr:zinc finger protein 62 homolog isoform X1 [Bombyx mori]
MKRNLKDKMNENKHSNHGISKTSTKTKTMNKTNRKKGCRQRSNTNKTEPEPTTEITLNVPKVDYSSPPSIAAPHARPEQQYSLCCCCMELPCPKNLWLEYTWMENTEVYGQMLEQCFGFNFPEDIRPKQQICEVCVTRLRDSVRFKRQVAECTKRLMDSLRDVKIAAGSTERIKEEFSPADHNNEIDYQDDIRNDSDEIETGKLKGEYVEEPERKYKTEDKIVGRPSKTKQIRNVDPKTPRANIGLLLQHTTILPFKSNRGYFNCFYCGKQFVVIQQLRVHTQTAHGNVTFASITKNILRPNDKVKADIGEVSCRLCSETLNGLPQTVEHLETKHNVQFNYKEKMLKPTECLLCYDLKDGKFACVVCRSEFYFFKTLTKHMNEHSTNYVCDVCGKCFLLAERLKAHAQVHVSSSVSCDVCGKTCATVGRLRSHKRHHHNKRSYVCSICNKSFQTFRMRMQHFEEVHNRSPLDLSCKICTKAFKTTSHLGCHMRTDHFNIPYVKRKKNN